MKIYLPSNLDLDSIVLSNPPKFKPYKIDKLKYIINLLITLPVGNKSLLDDCYIPLNSTKLQGVINNYRKYLTYLIENDILETNNKYSAGNYSKGYRLTNAYQTVVKKDIVNDYTLKRNVGKDCKKLHSSVKNLNYLNKWFNSNLTVDKEYIGKYLLELLHLKSNNVNLQDYDTKKKRKKNPIDQYNHAKISLDLLVEGRYSLKRDDNVFRYHSRLTNMLSEVRNALTYKGQGLVSLDLKNSQPFLSILLLSTSFWQGKIEAPKINNQSTSNSEAKINNNKLFYFKFSNKHTSIKTKQANLITNIMLREILEVLDASMFSEYVSQVVKGSLYDTILLEYNSIANVKKLDRKQIKEEIFRILFSKNRYSSQVKNIFKKHYPSVSKLFAIIKRYDNGLLPRLLQFIESYLFIDVISKRISKEYPNAPIYTIHDSITTTQEYVEVVREIMEEELFKTIGSRPTIAIELWCKSNIQNDLDKLKEKALRLAS